MPTLGRTRPAVLVALLLAGNLAILWWVRGDRVPGWDLFGATYGVLALAGGDIGDAFATVWGAFLAQRGRPVFTGGESLLYGLLPGLLGEVCPWLLWSHALSAALVLGTLWWAAGRLRIERPALFAAFVASPALVSQSIVGLPHLASTVTTFVPAIVWVVTEARRGRPVAAGLALDALVFAAVGVVAFSGYESGKTFFVVPALAAVTLRGVPPSRRVGWIVAAGAIAWFVRSTEAMTTTAALAAIPRDAAGILEGLARIPRRYLVDWHLDFPALGVATLLALPVLRRDGAFWVALLAASAGLVSLSAFQFDGGFLSPHRFVLLFVVAALVVAAALSGRSGRASRVVWAVLAIGMAYTSYRTVRFAIRPWDEGPRNANADRVYPLPYNVSTYENHLWLERIRDARTAVALVRDGSERHVFLYGFSAPGEDGVNPQLFFSRLLLPLGRGTFGERVAFFDHAHHMFFDFPIRPLAALEAHLATLPTPFYVHVFEPVHDAGAVLAGTLNGARSVVVDLGLSGFRTIRVEAWRAPGPIPVPAAPASARARATSTLAKGVPGFCVLRWRQGQAGHSTLSHHERRLGAHLDFLRRQGLGDAAPWRYENIDRRVEPEAVFTLEPSTVVLASAYLEVPGPDAVDARFFVQSDDEVAVAVNGLAVVESLYWGPTRRWVVPVRLGPGVNELQILYHKYWHAGGLRFRSATASGTPLAWRCDPEFGTMEAP